MKNKKVICINGNRTKPYDKVIFIMKEEYAEAKDKKEIDFVKEAENIINLYKNKYIKKQETKNEKYNLLDNTKNEKYNLSDDTKKIIIKNNNKSNIIFYIITFYFYIFISLLLYTKL